MASNPSYILNIFAVKMEGGWGRKERDVSQAKHEVTMGIRWKEGYNGVWGYGKKAREWG